MIEAGFWFLLGFFFASWLAYNARVQVQKKNVKAFAAARTEILRLLETAADLQPEINITIIDKNGELEVETTESKPETEEEDPPAPTSSGRRRVH